MRIGRFARRYSGVRAAMVNEIPAYVEEVARAFQAGYNHAEREADELEDHRQSEAVAALAAPSPQLALVPERTEDKEQPE